MKYIEIDGIEYEVLPRLERIKKVFLGNPMVSYLIPRKLLLHLLEASGSPLIEESIRRPGGWRVMEIIYENDPPRNFVDKMAVRYGAFPMAIRNRKKLVNQLLRMLIDRHMHRGTVTIVGVGTGPATHIIDAMADHEHEDIYAYCIDLDSDAFTHGEHHKREHSLEERVHYIEGDARQIHDHVSVPPHIVKMIGLLEYLTNEECIELFQIMYRALNPGGSLITHGLIDRHRMDWFLKKVFNWHVHYRTGDQIIELLKEASFNSFEITTEPMGIYPLIIAGKAER